MCMETTTNTTWVNHNNGVSAHPLGWSRTDGTIRRTVTFHAANGQAEWVWSVEDRAVSWRDREAGVGTRSGGHYAGLTAAEAMSAADEIEL